jgi:hypothetical protein
MRATVGGQPVRFYEVYWADLLRGDMMHSAFQMKELQSLSWFPLLNWKRSNYRPGDYSPVKLAWWCFALLLITVLVRFAYGGVSSLAWVVWGGKRRYTKVDRILDEYAGDVLSYVNSAGKAFYREKREPPVPPAVEHVYPGIVQRFYNQLVQAQADGCATIQIVAHSLGAVVTYHALSGLRFEPDHRDDAEALRAARAKVRHLYTIGNPLEKIRFFWPRLTSGEAPLVRTHLQWDNFISWFDPLAGMLRHFGNWGTVRNHRLLGGGFIRGHVVYEHSQVFLSALTRGLCGHEIPMKRTPQERWKDRGVLIGETLLTPITLTIVLIVGVISFVLTVILPLVLFMLLQNLFVPQTWAPILGPIVDLSAYLLIAIAFISQSLVVPLRRARKVHALYWSTTSSESGAGH